MAITRLPLAATLASQFADITEEGVLFSDPDDGAKLMLTPEESIRVQVRC